MPKKCARIIATCFKPKKVNEKTLLTGNPLGFYYHSQNFTTTEDIINLINFNIKLEQKIYNEYEIDLIIVNSDIGDQQGNQFIKTLEGKKTSNGHIRVMQRENIGLCFGAYSDAFDKYKDDYDYFIFTEDDLSVIEDNYVKRAIDIFEKSKNAGFLAFVGKTKIAKWHWNDLNIQSKDEAYSCHGAAGLSSSKILKQVYQKYGMLPHNSSDDYLKGITYGEVALPLSITRLGYSLLDQPKHLYFAIPSYDVMRNIKIIKFPSLIQKIIFYTKSFLYKTFNRFEFTKKIYSFVIVNLKK
jgi:hypothetical protein